MIRKKRLHDGTRLGFTLIELMFVTFIIALMARILVPRISNLFRINLKTTGVKVAGFLQSAYDMAALRHSKVRVIFNAGENTYSAEIEKPPSPLLPLIEAETPLDDILMKMEKRASEYDDEKAAQEEAAQFEELNEQVLAKRKIPDGVTIKSVRIENDPDGRKSTANQIKWIQFDGTGLVPEAVIELQHESGDIVSIVLPHLGGRAKVVRGELESK